MLAVPQQIWPDGQADGLVQVTPPASMLPVVALPLALPLPLPLWLPLLAPSAAASPALLLLVVLSLLHAAAMAMEHPAAKKINALFFI